MTTSACGAPLDEVLRDVMNRIAAASEEDTRARYAFGRLIHRIRYGDRGSHVPTVRALACELRVDTSALHRCARVTETISPSEFEWLVGLRTARGMPLSWSHIECLARERSAAKRALLAELAVIEESSVRALSAKVRKTSSIHAISNHSRIQFPNRPNIARAGLTTSTDAHKSTVDDNKSNGGLI